MSWNTPLFHLALFSFLPLWATFSVEAPQPSGPYRLGYLSVRADPGREAAFRERLRELGWVEGRNLSIEYRYSSSPDQLSKYAAELVGRRVDVIVAPATPSTAAARNATATIPIIMIGTADPVKSGFVKNLSRPGGNITGTSALSPELSAKRLELLKKHFPKLFVLVC